MAGQSARAELSRALRNRWNKCLPPVSDDAKRLFYEIAFRTGMNWREMQIRHLRGDDIFSRQPVPVEYDGKLAAVGPD